MGNEGKYLLLLKHLKYHSDDLQSPRQGILATLDQHSLKLPVVVPEIEYKGEKEDKKRKNSCLLFIDPKTLSRTNTPLIKRRETISQA